MKFDFDRRPRYLLPQLESEAGQLAKESRSGWVYPFSREIVEAELERQVEAGELWLSEWLGQREAVRSLAGDVLLGSTIICDEDAPQEDIGRQVRTDVPEWAHGLKIRVRAIDGKTNIHWTQGVRPLEGEELLSQRNVGGQVQFVENVVDIGKPEGDLTVKQAWYALRRHGKGVKRRLSPAEREQWELWQEFPPRLAEAPEGEGEPRRKRGWFKGQRPAEVA